MFPSGQNYLTTPFLFPTLAFIAGILIGSHIPLIACLLSLAGITSLLIALCHHYKKRVSRPIVLISLCALGTTLVHLSLHPTIPPYHISSAPTGRKVVLRGTIYCPPERKGDRAVIYLQAEGISQEERETPSTGRVRITIEDPAVSLRYGYQVRIPTKLYPPHNFRNPGAFDYERYLQRQGVLVTGYVRKGDQIEITSMEGGNSLMRWFDRWRQQIGAFLDTYTSPPGRGFLKALLIGEREEITDQTNEAFIATGTVHILSISGSHLSIIVTILFFSVQGLLMRSERALLRYDTRKVAALATFPLMLVYILITGLPIATIRSGIMASCFLVSILVNRYRNPLNTLAFAAFIILLCSPTSLWDPSFQLSFLSVLGIIVITPPIYRRLYPHDPLTLLTPQRGGRLKRGIALSLIASFAAVVVTSPVVAFHFHRFSTVALVSNAIIIPVVGFGILPLGLLCLPLIPFAPACGALLALAASELSSWGIRVMELISSLPFASYYLPGPLLVEMAIFYALIASLLWLKATALRRKVATSLGLLLLLPLSWWALSCYGEKELMVTFLDVGQGDCAVVEFPRGRRMLIDGGGLYGNFDVGEGIIAPFLWERRVMRVDYLVLTHPQPDHYKGLIFIAQHFGVQEFWHNGMSATDSAYRQLLQVIRKKGIKMIPIEEGFSRSIAGARIETLHPPKVGGMPGGYRKRGRVNNNSLVLKISFGDHSLLLAGDIEKEAEARLLKDNKGLRAQVLKIPHHGSKTSSTYFFVKDVSPLYAIISTGRGNPFHVPSRKIVDRYEGIGSRVFRTDWHGAITVVSDGSQLSVKTYQKAMVTPTSGGETFSH